VLRNTGFGRNSSPTRALNKKLAGHQRAKSNRESLLLKTTSRRDNGGEKKKGLKASRRHQKRLRKSFKKRSGTYQTLEDGKGVKGTRIGRAYEKRKCYLVKKSFEKEPYEKRKQEKGGGVAKSFHRGGKQNEGSTPSNNKGYAVKYKPCNTGERKNGARGTTEKNGGT